MTAMPAKSVSRSRSSSTSAPSRIADTGIRNVTRVVLVAPDDDSRLKYRKYANTVLSSARPRIENHTAGSGNA